MSKIRHVVKRARRTEQKKERRRHILEMAQTILLLRPYDKITMDQIARKSRLAKGTVYLYFASKEELFLALQEHELEKWFGTVAAALSGSEKSMALEELADLLCGSLSRESNKMHLFSSMNSVLERNVGTATAKSFKRRLSGWVMTTAKLIALRVPALEEEQAAQLLLLLQAMIIGIWQLSSPPPVLQSLYESPEFEHWKVEFAPALKAAFTALLRGTVTTQ